MKIPKDVLRLMWEYDGAGLEDAAELPDAVLERVMARGGIAQMRWILGAVERRRLAGYLEKRGRRVLAPRELRFWCRMAGIGRGVTDGWVEAARARERAWR